MKDDLSIFVLDDDTDRIELIKFHLNETGIKSFYIFKTEEEFFLAFNGNVRLAIINHHLHGNISAQNILERIEAFDKEVGSIIPTRAIILSGQREPNMVIYYSSKHADLLNKNDKGFYDVLIHYVKKNIAEVVFKLEVHGITTSEEWKNLLTPDKIPPPATEAEIVKGEIKEEIREEVKSEIQIGIKGIKEDTEEIKVDVKEIKKKDK